MKKNMEMKKKVHRTNPCNNNAKENAVRVTRSTKHFVVSEENKKLGAKRILRPRQISEVQQNHVVSALPNAKGVSKKAPIKPIIAEPVKVPEITRKLKTRQALAVKQNISDVNLVIPKEKTEPAKRVVSLRKRLQNTTQAAGEKENSSKVAKKRKDKHVEEFTQCTNRIAEPSKILKKIHSNQNTVKRSNVGLSLQNFNKKVPKKIDIYDFDNYCHDENAVGKKSSKSKLAKKMASSQQKGDSKKKMFASEKMKKIVKNTKVKHLVQGKLQKPISLANIRQSVESHKQIKHTHQGEAGMTTHENAHEPDAHNTPCSILQNEVTFANVGNFVTSTPEKSRVNNPQSTALLPVIDPSPLVLHITTDLLPTELEAVIDPLLSPLENTNCPGTAVTNGYSPETHHEASDNRYALFTDFPTSQDKSLLENDDFIVTLKKPKHDYSSIKGKYRKVKKPVIKEVKDTKPSEEKFDDWASQINNHFDEIDCSDLVIE